MILTDNKMALVEELVKTINIMEIVEVKDLGNIDFQRKSPKEILEFSIHAIHVIVDEKSILAILNNFVCLYEAIQEKLHNSYSNFCMKYKSYSKSYIRPFYLKLFVLLQSHHVKNWNHEKESPRVYIIK